MCYYVYLRRLDILRNTSVSFASIEINLCSNDEEILSICNNVWFWNFAMVLVINNFACSNSCSVESALLKSAYIVEKYIIYLYQLK
jgi:hypothetical protein